MTYMQIIEEFKNNPAKFSKDEIALNKANLKTAYAIGSFEGCVYTKETKLLATLIAEGRITEEKAAKLIIKHAA